MNKCEMIRNTSGVDSSPSQLSLSISHGMEGNQEQKHNFTGSESLKGSSNMPFYIYTLFWGEEYFCFMSII